MHDRHVEAFKYGTLKLNWSGSMVNELDSTWLLKKKCFKPSTPQRVRHLQNVVAEPPTRGDDPTLEHRFCDSKQESC